MASLRIATRAVRAWLFLAVMLVAAGSGTALAQPAEETPPEVGKYGKAFKGSEGEVVQIARIGPFGAGEFLVKVSRVDHPWDGVVYKAKAAKTGNGVDYGIEIGGERRNLVVERTAGEGAKTYRLYLDGGAQTELRYDEELSKVLEPRHLLTEYAVQEREKEKEKKKRH